MSVDLRTRFDGEPAELDAARLLAVDLPGALEASRDLLEPGARHLRLRPLTLEVDGQSWTLRADDGAFQLEAGVEPDAARVRLSESDLANLVADQSTPMSLYTSGTLDMPEGDLTELLDWWLVLRSALDRRRLHVPGEMSFVARDGCPLDLRRTFHPDDPREELSHFLHEAGFLHIAGLFDKEEMAEISADMDRSAPLYRDGDGRSWWVTVADGTRRLVRMQGFDGHSAAAAALLEDPRFLALGAIPGDGHVHTGLVGNRVEALLKPIGVVQGISDVPWHKDCSLGRHSYECSSLTVGVSVTGADARSGQLRVVAGSHRALLRPARVDHRQHGLPEIDLPTETGDVTVHLSCTLHMSQPPVERERRVLYTSFRLPPKAGTEEARAAAQARLRHARESAPVKVSQLPAGSER